MRSAVEGTIRSKDEWTSALGLSAADFSSLLERGVLEPVTAGLRLAFVGFAVLSKSAVVCLPKYSTASEATLVREAASLQRIFEKYRSRKHLQKAVVRDDVRALLYEEDRLARELDVFVTLQDWYRANGVYMERHRTEDRFGAASIHWPRTFGQRLALHSKRSVVYEAPVQFASAQRVNVVSAVCLSAIRALGAKYRLDGPDPTLHEDVSPFPVLDESELQHQASKLATLVQLERRRTFRTDTLSMLSALEQYLEDLAQLDGIPSLGLLGTSSFHVVWEDACRAAFGTTPVSLSQPHWTFHSGGPFAASAAAGGEQRPDIVVQLGSTLLVLDAKYYFPLPEARCGWGDLVKQYFYERSMDLPPEHQISNALLFPDSRVDSVRVVGDITMRLGDVVDLDYPMIKVALLNPQMLFDAYVQDQALPHLLGQLA